MGGAIDQHLDAGLDPFEGGEQEQHLVDARLARARMIARETASRRRRQVRHALIGLSVIALVLYVMGAVPLGVLALPPVALVAMWYASQRTATKRSSARGRQARATRQRHAGSAANSRPSEATRARRRPARRRAERHVEAGSLAAEEQQDDPSADVRLLTDDEIAQRRAAVGADGWDAVDSPLPQYVSASAGRGRGRGGGRAFRSDDWTARRMLEQVEALRNPAADAEAELGLDEYVDVPDASRHERRRAVNE